VPAHKVSRVLRRRGVAYLRSCDPMTGGLIRASKTSELRMNEITPASWYTSTSRGWVASPKAAGVPTAPGCGGVVSNLGSLRHN
jgi:hypothetical protein